MAYTNLELAAYAIRIQKLGARYWYGTFGQVASEGLHSSKKAQYPSHYTKARLAQYQADIRAGKTVVDCIGLFKAFFWTQNGTRVPKYADGFPDYSANMAISSLCKKTGAIKTIPDTPGLLLWCDGHAGVSIGNGYAIEARGFDYGVVQTKISSRSWTKWGMLKDTYLTYVNEGKIDVTLIPILERELGGRLIKRGSSGTDVLVLQQHLIELGYGKYLGADGADGQFGQLTEGAVRAFQKANGLQADGQFGPLSWAKMQVQLAAISSGSQTPPNVVLTEDDMPDDPEDDGDAPDSDEEVIPDAAMGMGSANPYPMPTQTKQRGDKGQTIRWIQKALVLCGYTHATVGGQRKKLDIDGDFGPITEAAVIAYQRRHAIERTGRVGDLTRTSLASETGECPHDEAEAVMGTGKGDRRKAPDVSYYDGVINFDLVDVPHMWPREGDSLRKRDPQFINNVRGCIKKGIPFSPYLFFRAGNKADALAEIETFCARVKQYGEGKQIGCVLDIEVDSVKIAAVRAAITRYYELMGSDAQLAVYMAHHMYSAFKAIMILFAYWWVPRYNKWTKAPAFPWHVWQGGFGAFTGIRGGKKEVDCNQLADGLTYEDLFKMRPAA